MNERNNELYTYMVQILANPVKKLVISHPKTKSALYKKININRKKDYYQIEKYTDKQVFHENIKTEQLLDKCIELIDGQYLQVNAWSEDTEYALLISKKGSCALRKIQQKQTSNVQTVSNCATGNCAVDTHNRKKIIYWKKAW